MTADELLVTALQLMKKQAATSAAIASNIDPTRKSLVEIHAPKVNGQHAILRDERLPFLDPRRPS